MLYYDKLIGLVALFGVYQYYQTSDKFAKTIICGQVVAIILRYVPLDYVPLIGRLLFMLTLVLAIVYAVKKDFTLIKRLIIIAPAVFVFMRQYLQLQDHPGVGLLSFLGLIPIIAYLIAVTTDFKNYKNEFGFLTIIIADAIIRLSIYIF